MQPQYVSTSAISNNSDYGRSGLSRPVRAVIAGLASLMVAVRTQPLEVERAAEGVHRLRIRDTTEQKVLQGQFTLLSSLM